MEQTQPYPTVDALTPSESSCLLLFLDRFDLVSEISFFILSEKGNDPIYLNQRVTYF